MKTSKIIICILSFILFCGAGAQLFAQESVTTLGDIITLQKAESLMENYDSQQTEEIRGHLYGSQALQQLLVQPGVEGVKIYNALDEEGTRKLVFKGLGIDELEVGLAFDISKSCPPACGRSDSATPIEEIGASIPLAIAQEMIDRFAINNLESPSSYTFSASLVKEILIQKESKGLFLAYGTEQRLSPQLILLGITLNGDLLMQGKIGSNPKIEYSPILAAEN